MNFEKFIHKDFHRLLRAAKVSVNAEENHICESNQIGFCSTESANWKWANLANYLKSIGFNPPASRIWSAIYTTFRLLPSQRSFWLSINVFQMTPLELFCFSALTRPPKFTLAASSLSPVNARWMAPVRSQHKQFARAQCLPASICLVWNSNILIPLLVSLAYSYHGLRFGESHSGKTSRPKRSTVTNYWHTKQYGLLINADWYQQVVGLSSFWVVLEGSSFMHTPLNDRSPK